MFRIAATLLTLAIALPAAAQETRDSARAKLDAEFAQTDANKDGSLSIAEVEARIGKMKVGPRTIQATNVKRMVALFMEESDADKNGRVSKAESQAVMNRMFTKYDRNKDGLIDGKEAAPAKAAAQGASAGSARAAKPSGR